MPELEEPAQISFTSPCGIGLHTAIIHLEVIALQV